MLDAGDAGVGIRGDRRHLSVILQRLRLVAGLLGRKAGAAPEGGFDEARPVNAAKGTWFAFVFLLLVGLQYTLRPVLAWRAPIDFLVIALLLVAVRARPGVAAMVGFALGLLADSLTPGAFGAGFCPSATADRR